MIFVCAAWLPCSTLWAQSPLPKVLSHSFEELRAAFADWQVPPGDHPEEVLLEETRFYYAENGALTTTHRRIWKLKSRQVSEYGIIAREYAPWYENPPEIQARVFDPNGREFTLSKEDITTSPAGSRDQGVLSDRLVVNAALPGVKAGAIIEEVIEIREREPFFAHGSAERFAFDSLVPSKYLRLEIDAPVGLGVQLLYRPARPEGLIESSETIESPETRVGRSVTRLELPQRKQLEIESFEADTPRDLYQQQSITITSGSSWQRIAKGYSEIIDSRLNSDTIDEIASELLASPEAAEWNSIESKIHGCTDWVRQNIRYTGVQLGNAAIVPSRPSSVLARGFGDCKDQATLLVGLLRACGVRADVALVNASTPRSPSPDAPCLNAFNHAIVAVQHNGQTLWIDSTFPGSTPRCIPSYLQAHWALIAHPDEQSLTMIPEQGIDGNQDREERTISINSTGNATIRSLSAQSGYFAAEERTEAFGQTLEEDEKTTAERYAQSGLAVQVRLLHRSDPVGDAATFTREYELRDLPLEQIRAGQYRVDLTFRSPIADCPFFHAIHRNERGADLPRKHPAEVLIPYRWSRANTLIAPSGYRIVAPTRNQHLKVGIIELTLRSEYLENGSMRVEQSLTVHPGLLSPEELQQLSALEKQLESLDHPLNFASVVEPADSDAIGAISPLLADLKRTRHAWQSAPSGDAGYEYVAALVAISQIDEAKKVAREMLERMPDEGMGHAALAYASLHDEAGRKFGFDCDIPTAIRSAHKAIELSPHRWQPYFLLSLVLNVDAHGVHHNRPEAYEQVLAAIEAAESKGVQDPRLIERKVTHLLLLHRDDAAIKIATEHRLEQMLHCAMAVKAARAARWSDITALRDRIPSANEREIIASLSEQFLLTDRDYETPARMVYTMRGMTDQEIEERRRNSPKIAKLERPENPTQSPESVVRELLLRVVSQGHHQEAWSDILAPSPPDADLRPNLAPQACSSIERLSIATENLRNKLYQLKACSDRMYDTVNLYPIRMEGDDNLGRIAHIKMQLEIDVAIVKEGEGYRILTTGPSDRNYALQAQHLLDAGRPEYASRWLDWALKPKLAGAVLAPDTGHPVKRYWTTVRKKTPEAIQTAIHMLLYASEPTPARRQFLMDAMDQEKSGIKRQWILMSMMMSGDDSSSELLDTVRQYVEAFPNSMLGKIRLTTLEGTRGNVQAMRDFVEATDQANDPASQRFKDMIRFHEGAYADLLAERVANAAGSKSPDVWNEVVWAGLFANEIQPAWMEELRSVLAREPDTAALHTLACAEAHLGNIDSAVSDLSNLVSMQWNRIEEADYWILGRIAEHADLPERARSFYNKIRPTPRMGSAYALAKLRLAAMDSAISSHSAVPSTDAMEPTAAIDSADKP